MSGLSDYHFCSVLSPWSPISLPCHARWLHLEGHLAFRNNLQKFALMEEIFKRQLAHFLPLTLWGKWCLPRHLLECSPERQLRVDIKSIVSHTVMHGKRLYLSPENPF